MRSFPDSGARAPIVLAPRVWRASDASAAASLAPAAILRLTLLGLIISSLGRIPVFSTGERDAVVHVNDFLVLAVLLTGGLTMAWARRAWLDDVTLSCLLFAGIGLVAALLAGLKYGLTPFELAVSVSYLVRWLFYFAIYVVAINVLRQRDVRPLYDSLETAILIFAAFGIVQSAFMPNFALMVFPESRPYTDWDPQYHRLVSTILDPNFAGALILSVLLVQLAQLAVGMPVPVWKPLLLTGALLLTASRSSVLALLVAGLLILAVRGISRRLLRFGGVVLLAILIASPRLIEFAQAYNKLSLDDPSAMLRVVSWLRGLTIFLDNPIVGIGFNTYGFVQESYGWQRFGVGTYSIEGGLLFVLVTTGVVGLVAYFIMLWRAMACARSVWRKRGIDSFSRALAIGAAAYTVALVVHSGFTNSLFHPFLMEPMFVLWALTRVIREEHRNGGVQAAAPG